MADSISKIWSASTWRSGALPAWTMAAMTAPGRNTLCTGRRQLGRWLRGNAGLLFCGTGCGISLSANRVKGIRCCNCSEPVTARLCREHNNCNMLAMGGRIVGAELAFAIADSFLDARFITGGRHEQRVNMIEAIDRN